MGKTRELFNKILFSSVIPRNEQDVEETGRRRLFVIFLLLLIVPLLIFGSIWTMKGSYSFGLSDITLCFMLIFFILILRRMRKGLIFYRITTLLLVCILTYWLYTGAVEGTASLWVIAFPSYAFFLMGRREGLYWTVLVFAMCLLLFIDPWHFTDAYRYPTPFVIRHLGTLLLVLLFTYNYESVKELFRDGMRSEQADLVMERNRLVEAKAKVDSVNALLSNEVEIREKVEDELRRHRDNLEAMVEERTNAILYKNEQLGKALEELASVNRELSTSRERLAASESRYRLLADNVTDLIWATDMNLKFQYVSPSVYHMYGYTVEEAMNLMPEKLNTRESFERIARAYQVQVELENSGTADPDRYVTLDVDQIRKDGSILPVEMKVSFLRNEEKAAVGIIGVTRDISERKKTQEILIQTEKMMTVGGLAAGMAHEINNPLSIILSSAQNMENRLSAGRAANAAIAEKYGLSLEMVRVFLAERGIFRYIGGIQEAGKRASEIVKNMLSFSRRSESSPRPHVLKDLVERSIDLASKDYDLKKKYDFRRIRIVRNYEEPSPKIDCVGTEIEQVIINLLKNAAYAISEIIDPHFRPEIGITLLGRDGFAVLDIADNGPGIDRDRIRRIFEPFYTTKEPGSGTGLGLSVSYFIITNNHHGTISVESEPGKGARFCIRLPFSQASPVPVK